VRRQLRPGQSPFDQTGSAIATAAAYPSWRLLRKFRATKSEVTIFRRLILINLFGQCSHYCELVSQPGQMPRVLEIAMQTAIAQRGVAVVAMPVATSR
jgi:hypothetical protein